MGYVNKYKTDKTCEGAVNVIHLVHSVEQKSIGLNFSKS